MPHKEEFMKIILNYISKKAVAVITALSLLVAMCGINIIVNASDTDCYQLQNNSAVGGWCWNGSMSVDSSNGRDLFKVIPSGGFWAYPGKLSGTVSGLGISKDNIDAISFYISNPTINGNGYIGLWDYNEPGGWHRNPLSNITATLYDVNAETKSEVYTSDVVGAINIPAGFEGYVIYDVKSCRDAGNLGAFFNCDLAHLIYYGGNANNGAMFMADLSLWTANMASVISHYESKNSERLKPPTANVESGLVDYEAEITLVPPEDGCEIYYTVDGSDPTEASIKFDVNAPIVIKEVTVVRAIAVKNGKKSTIATFKYDTISPDAENTTVVNDGSDLGKLSFWPENAFTKATTDGISPNGSAYSMQAQVKQVATLVDFTFDKRESSWTAVQNTLSFYARIPAGMSLSYAACINAEGYYYKGTMATYNIVTGEYKEHPETMGVTLSDFEGYVIFKLDDATVNTVRYEMDNNRIPLKDYIKENGFGKLVFYIPSTVIGNYIGYDMSFDHFAFSLSYEKLKADLLALELAVAVPSADPPSGTVPAKTNINLSAQQGADIYYTLDGSEPTEESTKYQLIDLGNNTGFVSPIQITDNTVIKAIAVKDGRKSGVSTFTYEIERVYDGPNTVIINDGSGAGGNIVNWCPDTLFSYDTIDDVSPDGTAFKISPITKDSIFTIFSFKANTEGMDLLHKTQAFSFYIKVPDLGERKLNLYPRINMESVYYAGKVYAVSTDGQVQVFNGGSISLSNFEGVVICSTNGSADIQTGYGASSQSWESYIKTSGISSLAFLISLGENKEDIESNFIIDSFAVHYDLQAVMEKYEIDSLLAEYDVETAENANMIVTNDCNNGKVNGALTAKSENLLTEASDYSTDDRCMKLTFGEGDADLTFMSYTQSEEATIADGLTFWVEAPKGVGDIPLGIELTEGDEKFNYSDNKFYFLADKDGYLSRVEGKLTIPNGFRGWIILPNDNIKFDEASKFKDGAVNYAALSGIKLYFQNNNNALKEKVMYLDDISFYVNFERLALSRAIAWKE